MGGEHKLKRSEEAWVRAFGQRKNIVQRFRLEVRTSLLTVVEKTLRRLPLFDTFVLMTLTLGMVYYSTVFQVQTPTEVMTR